MSLPVSQLVPMETSLQHVLFTTTLNAGHGHAPHSFTHWIIKELVDLELAALLKYHEGFWIQ